MDSSLRWNDGAGRSIVGRAPRADHSANSPKSPDLSIAIVLPQSLE